MAAERPFAERSVEETAHESVNLTVDVVVFSIRDGELNVLLAESDRARDRSSAGLPSGPLRPGEDMDTAALRVVGEVAGAASEPAHVEQLRAYDAAARDAAYWQRTLSIGYVAVQPEAPAGGTWVPAAEILDGTYALPQGQADVVRDAVERIRTDLRQTALSTAFLRETFTEAELRAVYEAVWGAAAREDRPTLDAPNFHRSLNAAEPPIVERIPNERASTGGRPAALYRPSEFVREGGPTLRLARPMLQPKHTTVRRRLH
jgi:8-oxo-dGTP diphosphatase